jgi:tetratricopeptide (TPR) repeat protein
VAGARQARLHRPDRDAKRKRDFFVAQAIDLAQHDRRALVERQGVERLLQARGELLLGEQAVGAERGRRKQVAVGSDVGVERHLIGAMTPPPEAVPVAGLVHRDPVNPGAERRLTAKTADRPKHPQEHLLRQVEGFIAIAQQVDGQLHDHPLVFGDEIGKGDFIALGAPLDQRRFSSANFGPADCPYLLHGVHVNWFRPRPRSKVPERRPPAVRIEPLVKRTLTVLALLAVLGVGAALAYQAAAREREYRLLLAEGDAALRAEQTFTAIEAYSGAIALRPDSMLAHLRRGETYRRRHDLDNAARDFRMAVSLDPSAVRALEALGDVLYEQQWYGRAAEIYERRLKIDERAAGIALKLAHARYRDRNLDAALTAIAQTLRLDDRRAAAYYLRGLCLRERNDAAGAVKAFERAVERSPELVEAREELADLYAAAGRHADELEQLQLIAAIQRDRPERLVAVGLAYARAAREARDGAAQERQANLAVLTLGSALDRSDQRPEVYGALGAVWLAIANERNDTVDLRKALEALERAATTPGASSEVLTNYGRALVADGQLDLADGVLAQATQRFPVEPAAFAEYAALSERLARFEPARRALIEYCALRGMTGEFSTHALTIARLSVRMNDPETAVTWLTRAAAAAPNDVRVSDALQDAEARLPH